MKVMELLSYGYENRDIAKHFQTTAQAVKNMLHTINLKLGADNRTHAVSICFRNGWLPVAETSPSNVARQRICVDGSRCTSGYTFRRYEDGTVDSFCAECGLFIARAWRMADLLAANKNHVCQPVERRRAVRSVAVNECDSRRADS
jgi:DNA-binding CsgD family transcriptional regulator